jgi:hypothetical protein
MKSNLGKGKKNMKLIDYLEMVERKKFREMMPEKYRNLKEIDRSMTPEEIERKKMKVAWDEFAHEYDIMKNKLPPASKLTRIILTATGDYYAGPDDVVHDNILQVMNTDQGYPNWGIILDPPHGYGDGTNWYKEPSFLKHFVCLYDN